MYCKVKVSSCLPFAIKAMPKSRLTSFFLIHCISIFSQTEEVDACVRMIETLLSDEADMLMSWGIEGVDYKEENGEKVVLDAAADNQYRLIYGMMFTYGSSNRLEQAIPGYMANVDPDIYDTYLEQVYEGVERVNAAADQAPLVKPSDFTQIADDTIKLQETEGYELSRSIILKAIVGEISLEEYDAQVEKFIVDYQIVTDAYNEAFNAVKDQYGY